MGLPAFQIIGIVALVLTLSSTTLQLVSFFYPVWWHYSNPGSVQTTMFKVGMTSSEECRAASCDTKSLIDIEGEVEWLFISRIFLVFATFLCVLALLLHLIYLPVKREGLRSVAIYMLGAAGLFGLAGSFVFAAMYSNLGRKLEDNGTTKVTFAFPLSIVAGFFHIAASVVTAVATVKGARHSTTDEENFIV